jgi:hypothetical protein
MTQFKFASMTLAFRLIIVALRLMDAPYLGIKIQKTVAYDLNARVDMIFFF